MRFMSAAGADGFVGWLLAAIGGPWMPNGSGRMRPDQSALSWRSSPGQSVSRPSEPAGTATGSTRSWPTTPTRWPVVAGLDDQDRVVSLWVQREPSPFTGAPGGLVVVLNGPSSSGKSTLASAIQQTADTPWIRLLPDEFFQWHLPERYWAFGRAAGPWQEGFFAALAGLARAGNQVVTAASGLDDQAGWHRRLAGIGCLFTGLTPALAVCEQRERGPGDRAAGNAAREWHAVHQGWAYDLAIDTGAVDPRRAAALVLAAYWNSCLCGGRTWCARSSAQAAGC
jgi:chloramphenicol 3-O phosphotransferase